MCGYFSTDPRSQHFMFFYFHRSIEFFELKGIMKDHLVELTCNEQTSTARTDCSEAHPSWPYVSAEGHLLHPTEHIFWCSPGYSWISGLWGWFISSFPSTSPPNPFWQDSALPICPLTCNDGGDCHNPGLRPCTSICWVSQGSPGPIAEDCLGLFGWHPIPQASWLYHTAWCHPLFFLLCSFVFFPKHTCISPPFDNSADSLNNKPWAYNWSISLFALETKMMM